MRRTANRVSERTDGRTDERNEVKGRTDAERTNGRTDGESANGLRDTRRTLSRDPERAAGHNALRVRCIQRVSTSSGTAARLIDGEALRRWRWMDARRFIAYFAGCREQATLRSLAFRRGVVKTGKGDSKDSLGILDIVIRMGWDKKRWCSWKKSQQTIRCSVRQFGTTLAEPSRRTDFISVVRQPPYRVDRTELNQGIC